MVDAEEKIDSGTKVNKLGLGLALAFYVLSIVMVIINTSEGGLLENEAKTITIAHWQLEDGFRQGFGEAIKKYEELKAKEGIKVKVVQTTVPVRGYQQWFVTQLISGSPADIIELMGGSQLQNQYFVPLSNYIALPNPYNKGTPLDGIPWKDTYVDGMNGALDTVYAEYFGVGTFFHVMRVYVNKDLVTKATGSSQMPKTYDQWIECCKKLREYGKKIGKPIIPIGVRGLDKGTLAYLFQQYFSQLNGNLNDAPLMFSGAAPGGYEMFTWMAENKINRDRLLEAVDLTKELGRNFCEGFSSTDLEQTKFLFFTGNVGFFPEGTWNAWSMVKNSPFEVEVINIPVIGPNNRYYTDFTGQTSELGVGVGGKFGITKSSKNFDLALDFLHFLTSYKMNQITMMDYCKWPPAVIKAEYKGLLQKFRPVEGDARISISPPFSLDKKSRTKMLETLEKIIVDNVFQPQEYFWKQFIANIPNMIEEASEALATGERQLFDIEGQRSCAAAGTLASNLSKDQRQIFERQQLMGLENAVDRNRQAYLTQQGLIALRKLEKQARKKENTNGN